MTSVDKVKGHLQAECFNKLYVGGAFVDPIDGEKFPTFYPATGELLHEFPKGGAKDIEAAIAAAEDAWNSRTWADMKAADRAAIVAKMAAGIAQHQEMLAEIEAADVGKPFRQANMTLGGAAGEGAYWCSLGAALDAEQDTPVDSGGGVGGTPPEEWDVVYRRDPIGVVGLISAWNYPMNVAFRKVAPALVAGNCAILKPSEIAGLTCMFIGKLAHDAGVPPGVFSVVAGDRDAGAALASHPSVSMISFTGSSFTGSKVMEACAPKLSQCALELGGKSALVIFDDTDLERAVETTMKGFLTNGGQICTAHTRLVVQDDLKAPLLSKLKEELEKLPYCDDPITEKDRGDRAWESGMTDVVQPVVCKSQHQKVLGFLNDAKAAGMTVLTGGSAPDKPGYFVQPTVFVDAAQDSDVWQKEVFGPVLTVRTFSTEADAVKEANSTAFGLASTVMSSDPKKARRVANQIRAGAVYATSTGEGILAEHPAVSRGGFGCSGIGRELGINGLHEYTELKSINYTGFPLSDAAETKLGQTSKAPDDIAGAAAARRGLYAVTTGFFFTFAGYGAIENLLSTFHSSLGYYSSAMVYYAIAPGAFLSPVIISKLGTQLTMGIGALTYTAYALSIFGLEFGLVPSGRLMIACGAGVGLTCSSLWSAMGVYCKQQSLAYDRATGNSSLGFFNGFSYAGVQGGMLMAMLGSSVIMQILGPQRKLIFGALAGVAAIGNAVLFMLPTPAVTPADEAKAQSKPPVSVAAVPRLLAKSGKMRLLFLAYLSAGYSTSFASGTFTADAAARSLGTAALGYIIAAAKIFSVASSLLLGKLSDIIGRYPVFVGTLGLEMVPPLYLALRGVTEGGNQRGLILLLAACMGTGMTGSKLMVNTIVGDIFDMDDTSTALSCSNIATSLAAGSAFIIGPNASVRTKSLLFSTLGALSFLSVTTIAARAKAAREETQTK